MLATAERLNVTGDYLVLFQPVMVDQLTAGEPMSSAVVPDAPMVGRSNVEPGIKARLSGGQEISCGAFVGRWAPAR